MTAAWAAPPSGQRASLHLDLRPSLGAAAAVEKAVVDKAEVGKAGADKGFTVVPSSLHRPTLPPQPELQLPELGAERSQTRTPSRAEEFARRVHREGLPVARLWENKSALVSLGLNKKGKPGLWLVQKTH